MAVIKGLSGLEIGRLNKNVKTFKDCGLIIIIEANLHTFNYLDVTFDLRKDAHQKGLQQARQSTSLHKQLFKSIANSN